MGGMAEEPKTSLWRSRMGRWIEGVVLAVVGAAVWSWLTFVHGRFRWLSQNASWGPIEHGVAPFVLCILGVISLIVALSAVHDYRRGKRGPELRRRIWKATLMLPIVLLLCFASIIIIYALFDIATGRPAFGAWFS
jgi:hypothetical protein